MPISQDSRRIYITLPKTVAEWLEAMSKDQMRSLASMTALMVIRGLEAEGIEIEESGKGGKGDGR